ncbi:MAG TPA: POTRA domain-containing protein, partial [Ramlibacter sp.]
MKIPSIGAPLRPARLPVLLAAGILWACGVAAQPEGGSGPSFAIERFEVEGNTLLAPRELQALLAQHTGPRRAFADIRRVVQALEQAYRDRGWSAVVVQLPEQELDGGVVRVRVIEPRIGRVVVQGNERFSSENIRASLPGLREGETPNLRAISASLKVANTNPAKQTTLGLQGGDSETVVDANVRVAEDKPWRVGLNADNTGSTATGRTRIALLAQHANLWGRDHVGSLQYTTSLEEPSRVSVYGAGYHVPLYALGDSLDFFASHSNVDSGTIAAGVLNLQVSGKGSTAGARYNHTLPQWGNLSSTLVLGADWRAYRSSVDLAGIPLGNDITVHPLSLSYTGQLA